MGEPATVWNGHRRSVHTGRPRPRLRVQITKDCQDSPSQAPPRQGDQSFWSFLCSSAEAPCAEPVRRPLLPCCPLQLAVAPKPWVTLGVRKPQPGTPSRNLDFNPGVVCLSTKVPEVQLWMTTLEMPWRLRVSADTHPPSVGLGRGRLPPPSATPREQRSQTEGGDLSELVHTGSSISVLCGFGK